jgi:hypothetical protein
MRSVASGLEQTPEVLEEAALSVGAPRRKVFSRILAPMLAANLLIGGLFALWILSKVWKTIRRRSGRVQRICERVQNFHITVKEIDGTVVFLRKLERGGTEHSFGIYVAKLAGMPHSIVERATAILGALEQAYSNSGIAPSDNLRKRGKRLSAKEVAEQTEVVRKPDMQLSMFQLDDPVLIQIRDQIKGLDINSLTPLEALNKLNEIKKIAGL